MSGWSFGETCLLHFNASMQKTAKGCQETWRNWRNSCAWPTWPTSRSAMNSFTVAATRSADIAQSSPLACHCKNGIMAIKKPRCHNISQSHRMSPQISASKQWLSRNHHRHRWQTLSTKPSNVGRKNIAPGRMFLFGELFVGVVVLMRRISHRAWTVVEHAPEISDRWSARELSQQSWSPQIDIVVMSDQPLQVGIRLVSPGQHR